ncbi:MAG: hypothetical protein KDD35_09410 [Bdellovibrionales bacterium]|nr:hypothetical protein [Bdellovibrionales bacterium]
MLIFSRVWRDPSQGILSLNRDLQNSKLPINLRKDIEVWKKSFTDWKREIAGKSEDLRSRQQKVTYAKKILAEMKSYRGPAGLEPFLVPLLRVSGVLYEDLAQAKTKMDQAETLYYLGKIERLLSQSSFLLLGDLYLKECIHKAPHSKWAPACLTEYKEYLKWRYPGGVALPASISKEIKGFEKEIASAKKPASK